MSKINCRWICLLTIVLLVKGQKYTPVINTASGPVRGLILTTIENFDYAAFKGIPYAMPPIGYLRFKPPVEVDEWTDVYNATNDGNLCIQASLFDDSAPVGSEDCLYINIYTPHTSFDESISKPVMVWIHGGGYTVGASLQFLLGPDYILGENVIVVTLNYRVSAFGFLNVQHENATGNAAFKDQNLALKWVRKNIAYFGGNPDNVTLFGMSAGGSSTDFHALSDMSTGLFSQSISMSGSPLLLHWGLQRRDEALKRAFLLGSKLGIDTSSKDKLLSALYNTPAVDIATAAKTIGLFPFQPTLENPTLATDQEKFLTKCPPVKYANSNYTRVPHMMGFASDEAVTFFRGQLGDIAAYYSLVEPALQLLGNLPDNMPIFANLKRTLADAKAIGIENMSQAVANKLKNDINELIVLGIDTKQRIMSKTNNHPIYYYRFSFLPANSSTKTASGINFEGAGHADDEPYIFYNPLSGVPLNQSDVVKTRRRMVKLVTNFAKYGNPTPDNENDKFLGITWPDSRSDGAQLEIGTNLKIVTRQISSYVENLQLFGFGSSLYLNDCSTN